MKRILFLTLMFGYLCTSAQYFKISGRVTDSENKLPMSGAIIYLDPEIQIADENGSFSFEVPAGTYSLIITYLGYNPTSSTIEVVDKNIEDISVQMVLADNVLKTTTITGSRFDRPLTESTVSLEVIRPYLIRNTNTISVDQVLQKMPGVDIIDGQANVRGGSGFSYGAGTRVLLLLDDIPALQADAGFPNWNDFPVENIAQIEVLKGASSVMYGSSAMNGIINIRTGYPVEKPETKVSVFYTHFGSPSDSSKKWWTRSPFETSASILHKQKFGKLDVVAAGLIRKNESFNKGVYERYYRGSLNLRYRIHDRLVIGLHAIANPGSSASFFYWKDAEAGAYIGDSMAYNISERFRMNVDPYLNYFDKNGGKHKILARHYYVKNNNNENRSNTSKLNYLEYQYSKGFKSIGMEISSGIVTQNNSIQAELYGDTIYRSYNYAAYLQIDQRILPNWILSGGARLEYNEMRSPEQVLTFVIPGGKTVERKPVFRLGSNYSFSEYSALRASWGQGYRYPTVAERFINTGLGPVNILPNPNLNSETGWSAEIGYKQGLRIGKWTGFADAAVFWQEYDDMMEFTFTFIDGLGFGFQSQNIGDTRIRGFDCNLTGVGFIGKWETAILMGYTYIDPRYRDFTEMDSLSSSAKRNILKYRFQHTMKGDVETGKGKWRIGVSARYYSFMDNIDAIFEELVVPGLKKYRVDNNSGSTVIDVRASWQFRPWLKTSLLINNLMNIEYSFRPGLLEAPRNYSIRLDFDL